MSNLLERQQNYKKANKHYSTYYKTAIENNSNYYNYYFNAVLVNLKEKINGVYGYSYYDLNTDQHICLVLIFMKIPKEEIINMSIEEQLAYIYLFGD